MERDAFSLRDLWEAVLINVSVLSDLELSLLGLAANPPEFTLWDQWEGDLDQRSYQTRSISWRGMAWYQVLDISLCISSFFDVENVWDRNDWLYVYLGMQGALYVLWRL